MENIWLRVKALEGNVLETGARKKPFTVVEVRADRVLVRPSTGDGTVRTFRMERVQHIYDLGLTASQLTPSRVQAEYPTTQNSSYIAAIANAIRKG